MFKTDIFVLIKHGSWVTSFGLLNHANSEVIRELIKSLLHNFVENTASCCNYSCFGEHLDRKGPCSSEPDNFSMAVRELTVHIPFLLLRVSAFLVPSLPGFLRVTMQLGSFNF